MDGIERYAAMQMLDRAAALRQIVGQCLVAEGVLSAPDRKSG
jgi:hypothetical protein